MRPDSFEAPWARMIMGCGPAAVCGCGGFTGRLATGIRGPEVLRRNHERSHTGRQQCRASAAEGLDRDATTGFAPPAGSCPWPGGCKSGEDRLAGQGCPLGRRRRRAEVTGA